MKGLSAQRIALKVDVIGPENILFAGIFFSPEILQAGAVKGLMSTETSRLIRDGEKGVWRWGEKLIIYLPLHCHHQNDSRIEMGSEESHFNVSLIVRDKVARQCPQTTTCEEKGEPERNRTEVPLLTSLTPYR